MPPNSNTRPLLKHVYATALSSQKLSGLCLYDTSLEFSITIMVHPQQEAHRLPQSTAPICLLTGGRPRLWVADYTVSTCPWQIWLRADFLLQRRSSLKWDLCKLAKSC